MKVLVTGARGFIGRNLVENLKNVRDGKDKSRGVAVDEIFEYDVDTPKESLNEYCSKCDFVFDLAGVNRPKEAKEFDINHSFLAELLNLLKVHGNKCPVMLSSSTQALLENDYGRSKKKQKIFFFHMEKRMMSESASIVFRMCLANGAGLTTTALWRPSAIILPMICRSQSITGKLS